MRLGEIKYHKREINDSLKHYEDAIKVNPKNVWALLSLGSIYMDLDNFDFAI